MEGQSNNILNNEINNNINKIKQENSNEINSVLNYENLLNKFGNDNLNIAKDSFNTAKHLLENKIFNEWVIPNILQYLTQLINDSKKTIEKEYSMILISIIADKYPRQIKYAIIFLIPIITNLFNDPRTIIQNSSKELLIKIIKYNGNSDIEPFLPVILLTLQNPDNFSKAIENLLKCKFIVNIECSTISILDPLLIQGLKDNNIDINIKTCILIDNICKSVKESREILPFVYKFQPLLESCIKNIQDPTKKYIVEQAYTSFKKSCDIGKGIKVKTSAEIFEMLNEEIKKYCIVPMTCNIENITYISELTTNMCNAYYFEYNEWYKLYDRYFQTYDKQFVKNICTNIFNRTSVLFIDKT